MTKRGAPSCLEVYKDDEQYAWVSLGESGNMIVFVSANFRIIQHLPRTDRLL